MRLTLNPISLYAIFSFIIFLSPLPTTTALTLGKRQIRDCGPGASDCGRACCRGECGINGTCKPPGRPRPVSAPAPSTPRISTKERYREEAVV